uniref:Uncharacterized protein n=1 Tax=Anguilla anguilla TaxID=7936 RepID=A0A0E9P8Z6_ANGAN
MRRLMHNCYIRGEQFCK